MNTAFRKQYPLPIRAAAADVLNIESVLELLDVPEYDTLHESNIDSIEDRALWSYAYHKGYEFKPESWSMTKPCELCDGDRFTESGEDCPLCDGYGEIELDVDELRDSTEYEDAYSEAEEPLYEGWERAVYRTLELYCGYHDLQVDRVRIPDTYMRDGKPVRWYMDGYHIKPAAGKTWKSAAQAVQDTMSGYGYGYAHTALEMLQAGAFSSYKAAVLANLNSITNYGDVYDVKTPQRRYESELETNLYNW